MRYFSPLREENLILLKEGDKYVVLFESNRLERSEHADFESAYKAFQTLSYNEGKRYQYLVNKNMAALNTTHKRIEELLKVPE